MVPELDTDRFLAAWDDALAAPAWDGPDVLVHCDLLPDNVLIDRGRLSAVIDWGSLSVGDPARDLSAAWTLVSGDARAVFRAAIGGDDATWERARSSLLGNIIGVVYYKERSPAYAAECWDRAIAALSPG